MLPWLIGTTQEARRIINGGAPNKLDEYENQPSLRFQSAVFPPMWAVSTMPQIEVSHRLAASLMATTVPADSEMIVPPWKGFVILIPDLLLPTPKTILNGSKVGPWIRLLLVAKVRDQWGWLAATDTAMGHLARLSFSTDEIVSLDKGLDVQSNTPALIGQGSLDDECSRCCQLLGRLLAGVCISMSNQDKDAPRSGGGASKRKSGMPPMPWTVVLRGNVQVDCREAIRDYAAHGGKAPTVQSLVRGHWKRQTHGPGSQERKWIQVEPYWRGPEESAVVLRYNQLAKAS